MSVPTYTKSGTKASVAAKLDKAVFDVEVKSHQLVKDAYVAYLANGRINLAVTKTRGLVSGGGRKPWKQKGTGRARFGSSRNPIWRGGGVVFGPTGEENFTHRLPVAQKRLALRQALSLAQTSGKVVVLEQFAAHDKTAEVAALLNKIGAKGNTLVVIDNEAAAGRGSNNLANVKVVRASYLNVYDVMNADHVVLTGDALKAVSVRLGGDK